MKQPVVLFIFALLLIGPVAADEAAVKALSDRLVDMKSFQADFYQASLDAQGNMLTEAQGSFAVKRPGLLHWQAEPPLEQWIIADGEQLWLYDPDLEQVTVQPMSEDISQTPALLLSGEVDRLGEAYQVAQKVLDDGWVRFDLIPRAPDSLFEQLSLIFQGNVLMQMHLHDALGQRSSFEFSNSQVNPSLDDQLFQFTPPDGVDVISQ